MPKDVGSHLRDAFAQITQSPVSRDVWTQASTPLKLGGLGLRDPEVSRTGAGLASFINTEEFTWSRFGGKVLPPFENDR